MERGVKDLVGQAAASLRAVVGVDAQRAPSSLTFSLLSSPSLWREDKKLLGDGMQGEMEGRGGERRRGGGRGGERGRVLTGKGEEAAGVVAVVVDMSRSDKPAADATRKKGKEGRSEAVEEGDCASHGDDFGRALVWFGEGGKEEGRRGGVHAR